MLMPEARAQAGMTRHQRLHRRRHRFALECSLQPQFQLHRINVGRLHVIKRMEQQPLLQRRQRQDVLDLRIRALQPFDLLLRQRHQGQIAGGAAAGAGRRRVADKTLQRRKPALRQIANLSFRHQRRRRRPGGREPCPLAAVERERIDLEAMGERHGGIAAAQPHRLAGTAPVRRRRSRKPPEIVEADLRRGKPGKLRSRLRVQITQHP